MLKPFLAIQQIVEMATNGLSIKTTFRIAEDWTAFVQSVFQLVAPGAGTEDGRFAPHRRSAEKDSDPPNGLR